MSGEGEHHGEIIVVHRHGDHEEGHHGGAWKIAFADFMTAMMTFFLVMWLINSTDNQTLTQVATYFNPIKLTDRAAAERGVNDEQFGGSGNEPEEHEQQKKKEGKSFTEPKQETGERRFSEEELFADPYDTLNKLASQAIRVPPNSAGGMRKDGRAGGDAFRDPFDPDFRRNSYEGPVEGGNSPPTPKASDRKSQAGVPGKQGEVAPAPEAAEPAPAQFGGDAAKAPEKPAENQPQRGKSALSDIDENLGEGSTAQEEPEIQVGRAQADENGGRKGSGPSEEAKNAQEAAEVKEPKEAADISESKETKEGKEAAEAKEGKEAKEVTIVLNVQPDQRSAAQTDQNTGNDAKSEANEASQAQNRGGNPGENAGNNSGSSTKAGQTAERAKTIEADFRETLRESGLLSMPAISVRATPDGVLISLTDKLNFEMFAIASAEPRPELVVVMEKLANVLAKQPGNVIISGHTDARPFRSKTYDNWRLSVARAHVTYYMLVRGGVLKSRIERIEGHADRDLKIPGNPRAAQNRRIEILLRPPKI